MAPESATVFDDLPLRPPTPPREADKCVDDALQFLSDSFEVEEATGNAPAHLEPAFINTPPQHSPASSAGQVNGSSRRKKVDFSPWTAYHSVNDPPPSRRGLPGSPLRPLPQPRDPKTLKSILKAHDPPSTQPSTPDNAHAPNASDNFATMLEGLVKQLAGKSRPHKLDAYMALLSILKTYDGKPDSKALAGKMDLLAQFIERDMKATSVQTGGLDVQLALQALKLLVTLMEIGPVAARIPEAFRAFFLNKAIETFSDATAPKQWVNHVLHAFYQQRFVRTMSVDRAHRAITALKDIEDRVSGNNVIICRMLAYHTLLSQQQAVMVDRAPDWIQHIFHGLLSSNKDIRMQAVQLSTVVGIAVGDVTQISRVTMETLAKEIEEGKSYGEYFTDRLIEMLSDAETAPHVPHIWAAVGLLLRNRRRKLESWKLLRRWLLVFQKCVNSSNKEAAIQANYAWNRFVYALKPDYTTPQTFRQLLRQAIVAQFDRKGSDKDAQRMKRSAFSSYCNLLYYSLPPTAPIEQLDLYWQEFVVEVIPSLIKKERRGAIMSCRVLTALFKRNQTKLWKENLAVESPVVSLEHIMPLDPRWTRQRLGNILPSYELCLASAPWTCNSPSEEISSEMPVKTMWVALMSTVAEAGSKEVTASMDFKEACAQIMNLFHRIWTNHPKSLGREDDLETWIDKFGFLVLTTLELLGPGSFADPILSRNPTGNFEVAPTPSHRPKSRGSLQSPLLHLLRLFVSNIPSLISPSSVLRLSERLLELCCHAKPSRKSKLELLRNFAHESSSSSDGFFRSGIWRKCAKETETCLKTSALPTPADRAAQSLGEEYRFVLDILICGIENGIDSLDDANSLFDAFVSRVRCEVGDGGSVAAVALAIIEPLAGILQTPPANAKDDTAMFFATLVVRYTEHPKHRRAVEQARRILWGVSTGPQKPSDFDPFNHLYNMIVSRLQASYDGLENLRGDLIIGFSTALGTLVQRWPVSFTTMLLRRIQDGIAIWVEDAQQKLAGDAVEAQGGREAVYTLWNMVMTSVEQLPKHDTMLLKVLDTLIVAGLRSRRQRIVNRTIETWNKTFGGQKSLQYPVGVEKGLRRLRAVVELQLPDFPEGSSKEEEEPIPIFEDSQEELLSIRPPLEFRGPSSLPRHLNDTALPSPLPSDPTLNGRSQTSLTFSSKPKAALRHDDSQMAFAPIQSAPVAGTGQDSQLLTDHQKEVREKQQEAAAMFADISPSPAKPLRDQRLDLSRYAKPGRQLIPSDDAEPRSTPILNLQEYGGNQDVPSSSPTPKARIENRYDAARDVLYPNSSAAEPLVPTDIPSSPPGLDDENGLPVDSSTVNERFVKSIEAPRTNPVDGLEEELGEEVVNQLVGDVSNLSDTNLSRFDRDLSHVSVSSRYSESELGSSEIDDEVSQQLENEVIAQALRRRDAPNSSAKKLTLPDDTTIDGGQEVHHSDTAGDLLDDLLGDGEDISSFNDIAAGLPQGTADTVSEPPQRVIVEDVHSTPSSPTEKDTSSIDLPIRASPAKARPRPETIKLNQPQETFVEDSFIAPEAASPTSVSTKTSAIKPKQTTSKASRHRKRKSETIADFSLASKRPKKKASLPSHEPPDAQRNLATGSGSDSDDSLLSNIRVDTSSDGPLPGAKASFSRASTTPLQSSQPQSKPANVSVRKEKKGRKSVLQAPSSPRASPRLSGVAPEPALTRFHKRKSRLSESQTTEADIDEVKDASVMDNEAVEETPAPKKRKGRTSKAAESQASSQASNASSSVKMAGSGNHSRNSASLAEVSVTVTEMASQDVSQSGSPRSTSGGNRTTESVAGQKKKRRRSYDKKGGAGGTTAVETREGKRAESQEGSASQGSTASNEGDERPKLQPQSIIARLKRVLSDCKNMVLGREEERKIDDVMFELRREVHAAARRGEMESGN
ncbi:Rap1-interacting factor 1 N terminal-domain-containing protein [Macrophomina phaseolina]|uniref:Rap1-interacting factor 1 N terminal-domain-containing protein n=1 Tax=Macrophomina phaseolina TaxID=35725 RepID=A0ABQ8FXD4_9PEZI|nr:Rap1-interacting factor 1 N terminal-domain-containing protein [Macrophomina phaseolina]